MLLRTPPLSLRDTHSNLTSDSALILIPPQRLAQDIEQPHILRGRNNRKKATPRINSVGHAIAFVQLLLDQKILHYKWRPVVYEHLGVLLEKLDPVKQWTITGVRRMIENQRAKRNRAQQMQWMGPKEDCPKVPRGQPPELPSGDKEALIRLQLECLDEKFDEFVQLLDARGPLGIVPPLSAAGSPDDWCVTDTPTFEQFAAAVAAAAVDATDMMAKVRRELMLTPPPSSP